MDALVAFIHQVQVGFAHGLPVPSGSGAPGSIICMALVALHRFSHEALVEYCESSAVLITTKATNLRFACQEPEIGVVSTIVAVGNNFSHLSKPFYLRAARLYVKMLLHVLNETKFSSATAVTS